MKKINKLIAILLVAVCVLSGCAGSNTGKQEETVTMMATVTSLKSRLSGNTGRWLRGVEIFGQLLYIITIFAGRYRITGRRSG